VGCIVIGEGGRDSGDYRGQWVGEIDFIGHDLGVSASGEGEDRISGERHFGIGALRDSGFRDIAGSGGEEDLSGVECIGELNDRILQSEGEVGEGAESTEGIPFISIIRGAEGAIGEDA
jgi:hypothetical protein